MPSNLERALVDQINFASLPAATEQYAFARPRRWRFDLAWPARMVAVEIDGGTWSAGRHVRGAGYEADCIKLAEAACRGWTVIRVTGGMVLDGRALALVQRLLEARHATV